MHVLAPAGFNYCHPASASSIHGIFVSFRRKNSIVGWEGGGHRVGH